jgi:glycosyltransferase involved in cell wall biosynthesis
MTVCAVMLVKDEADVIPFTLRHLRGHVDHIIVADNLSTDQTRFYVEREAAKPGCPIEVRDDPEVGYYQSDKTSALAREVYDRGFGWVLPCDADEVWYAPDGRAIRDWLDGVAPDVQIVSAALFNHIPTVEDPEDENPFRSIVWRQRQPGALPKVLPRARPDLVIGMGNHSAHTQGTGLTVPGLVIRHFSWRTEEQYVRKIRNGVRAYEASTLDQSFGVHWRMWSGHTDDSIREHYRRWFLSERPLEDASLIMDPAPLAG